MSDHGNATIAQLLIEAGANVDIANSVCLTLFYSVMEFTRSDLFLFLFVYMFLLPIISKAGLP